MISTYVFAIIYIRIDLLLNQCVIRIRPMIARVADPISENRAFIKYTIYGKRDELIFIFYPDSTRMSSGV